MDPARDHGDPQPDDQRFYDPDLFLKGPQDDPSPELLAAVRQVHPVARPISACPTVEPMRPEWWEFPGYVVVRRIFDLKDGSLKVPVLTYRPHSGCKQFAFYLALPAADGWRMESPRVTQSLCH